MRSSYSCSMLFMFLVATAASAVEPLSLSLIAPDLSSLRIGTPVSLSVELRGLAVGDSLDYVAATVAFDGSLFTAPSFTPGLAIPDPTGLVFHAEPGLADVFYDELEGDLLAKITQSGVLFNFSVTPVAAGNGSFEFQFSDALGHLAAGGAIDGIGAGSAMPFSVVVPEPSTTALCGLFVFLAAKRRAR